jgi:peptide chain release factor 1
MRLIRAAASRHVAAGSSRTLCSAPQLTKGLARHVAALVRRHDALQETIAAGEFSVVASRELARLKPIARAHAQLRETADEASGLREMIADGASEAELRDLARAELEVATAALAEQQADIVQLLVPPDPEEEKAAERGVLIEVHAGVGGAEAGLFAQELLQMYQQYAKRKGWRFESLSHSAFEHGGCREATVSISGAGVYSALRGENGTHRVQRVPATESLGRVHTSTAVVAVLPELGTSEVPELNEADVVVEVMRAGGAGGQHVNTTESAVRLTHTPTGIKAYSQNERSQHSNRATAFKLLAARIAAYQEEKRREEMQAARGEQVGTGGRAERIRTYNFSDDRITDHRIGSSKFGMPAMLTGELIDDFGAELRAARDRMRLQHLLEDLEREEKTAGEGAASKAGKT